MPGDEEDQGPGRKLQHSAIAPNDERSAPGRANRIGKADPLWARFAAGALTLTLTATSAAVPPTDAFLNSTSRINTGVTMPSTEIYAPQGPRASESDLARLSSDSNIARLAQSGHQDLLIQRVNDLIAALEGTGQPYRREVMLGGVRNQQAWAERYSSLTEGQKQAFRDQAILMMAQNFGEQFGAGQAVRINDAFGSVVRENLENMFAQATAAPAEAQPSTESQQAGRSWLASIPVIGRLFGAVPVAEEVQATIPFTLEAAGGAAVTLSEEDARRALITMGIPESEVDSLASAQASPEEQAYIYFTSELDYQIELQASAGPLTPEKVRIAREAAIAGTAGFLLSAFPNQSFRGTDEQDREVDVMLAGVGGDLAKTLVFSVLLYGAGAAAHRLTAANYAFETATFTDLATVMDRTVQTRRDRASATALEDAQSKLQVAETTAADLEARVQRIETRLDTLRSAQLVPEAIVVPGQAERRMVNPNQPEISRLEAELNGPAGQQGQGLRQQLEAARLELTNARAAVRTVQEAQTTGTRGIETFIRTELPEALRQARAQGRTLEQVLENLGFNAADRQAILRNIDPWRVDRINTMLAAERFSTNFNATAEGGKFRIEPMPSSAFERVFMEPIRAIRGGGFVRGAGAFVAAPFRITAAGISEIRARRGTGGIAWGAAGVAGMLWLGWEFEYLTGMTNYRSPVLGHLLGIHDEERREETAGGTAGAAPQAARLTQEQQQAQRAATNFSEQASNLGNTDYRNLRDQLEKYRQYIIGTTSANFDSAATLDRISTARVQAGTEFLANFQGSAAGMSAAQAELEFYRQFFISIAPANAQGERTSMLVNIIDTYIPETERTRLYADLFSKVALKNTRNPVTDQAELFAGLYKQSERLRDTLAPILAVVDARFGLGDAHEDATITAQVAAAYLVQLNLTVALRGVFQLQQGPEPLDMEDVAFWLAKAYMQNNQRFIQIIEGYTNERNERVPGFFSDVGTQLEAYRNVLAYLAAHPNARQDEVMNNALLSLIPANRRSAAMQLLQVGTAEVETGAAVQAQATENARRILQGRERGQELLDFVDASLPNESDRLAAYNSIIQYFTTNPDFANAGYEQLKAHFISGQLGAYADLRSAVEAFFTGTELDSALSYLIRLTKEALAEPGVRTRSYTYTAPGAATRTTVSVAAESAVGDLLVRQLVGGNTGLRNDLDALYIGEPARRRGEFDTNRFLMLLDAAVFINGVNGQRDRFMAEHPGEAVPAELMVTSELLHEHFINEFNTFYPGLEMGTVLPERQFDLVLALLPLRDNSGAMLSESAMLETANGPQYWQYRTADWVRAQYEELNATEKSRMFYFLPEDMQREYWNGMNRRERDTVWRARAPTGDTTGLRDTIRAWQSSHAFLKTRGRYQSWEE